MIRKYCCMEEHRFSSKPRGFFIFSGHPKSLDQFTYQDKDINDIILSCMSNVSLTGVSGRVLFENGIDPIKDCKVQRVQGKLSD